jgi:glycosyltransferase involved in cell wall biosynthesis
LPTFNGEEFIAESIASLLAQDYPALEILISDNASTDRTGQIASDAAASDSRVRYERLPTNRGAVENFNHVLRLATGTYFMWASDHDLWAPDFVSSCVGALEGNPAAVLAYPETTLIDRQGAEIEIMDDQIRVDQTKAITRYKTLIWHLTICNMIYGVGRRDAMQATGGARNLLGPDHLVLANLALRGPILRVGGRRFYRRQNRPSESTRASVRRVMLSIDPDEGETRARTPHRTLYRQLRNAHLKAVLRSTLSWGEKLDAILSTLSCFAYRFGVTSMPLRVVRRLARMIGAQSRLDGWLGLPVDGI